MVINPLHPSRPAHPVVDMIAIDPGSVHVGVAQFRRSVNSHSHYDVWAKELEPDQTINWLWDILENLPLLPDASKLQPLIAYEGFRVRSGTPLGGSNLVVVQMIGAIRAIANRYGAPLIEVSPPNRSATLTRISRIAHPWAGVGNHAHDAQAVGVSALGIEPENCFPHRDNIRHPRPPLNWPLKEYTSARLRELP